MSRLEELKEQLFLLEMKDRWDKSDFELYDQLQKEISKLEKEVENEQGNRV